MKRLFACIVLTVSLGGCKQGLGEVCQVNSDCESGLVCTTVIDQPLQHCAKTNTTDPGIDAAAPDATVLPPDATPLDAGPPDAAI
jgi:hypothetical protein